MRILGALWHTGLGYLTVDEVQDVIFVLMRDRRSEPDLSRWSSITTWYMCIALRAIFIVAAVRRPTL